MRKTCHILGVLKKSDVKLFRILFAVERRRKTLYVTRCFNDLEKTLMYTSKRVELWLPAVRLSPADS